MTEDPTAAVIVLDAHGKALILRRGMTAPWYPGYWNLPGGGIDLRETPEQAAGRELKEESNLSSEDLKKFKTVRCPEEGFVLHVYITDDTRGDIHLEENDKYEWVGLEDLSKYRFVPTVEKLLQEALNRYSS